MKLSTGSNCTSHYIGVRVRICHNYEEGYTSGDVFRKGSIPPTAVDILMSLHVVGKEIVLCVKNSGQYYRKRALAVDGSYAMCGGMCKVKVCRGC